MTIKRKKIDDPPEHVIMEDRRGSPERVWCGIRAGEAAGVLFFGLPRDPGMEPDRGGAVRGAARRAPEGADEKANGGVADEGKTGPCVL